MVHIRSTWCISAANSCSKPVSVHVRSMVVCELLTARKLSGGQEGGLFAFTTFSFSKRLISIKAQSIRTEYLARSDWRARQEVVGNVTFPTPTSWELLKA